MPETKLAEHLRRYPLFAKLPEAELQQLVDRARSRSFKRGEMIFRKDDPGTHLYMVLEGAVKIALPGEFGQEALVAIMRPGEFFGELALFDRSPRGRRFSGLPRVPPGLRPGRAGGARPHHPTPLRPGGGSHLPGRPEPRG